jgi:hypothetical protein
MPGDPLWRKEQIAPSVMTDKLWWMLVVGECQRRGYPPSFYADRDAWLKRKHTHNEAPNDAIRTFLKACYSKGEVK